MLRANTHFARTPDASPDDPGWMNVQNAVVPDGTPADSDSLTAFLTQYWATMPAGGPFPAGSCSFRQVVLADQSPDGSGDWQQVGYAQITI